MSQRRRHRSSSPEPPPGPHRPRKRFGQHFLTDPRILARIADAALLEAGDTVIEIGPGRGALTDALRARASHVVAIEVDRDLAGALRARYAGDAHVSIVEGDVLAMSLGELGAASGAVLVGNVPYYITTPIIFQALEPPRAKRAVFLVQREVAERIVAPPGSKTYGALSVNVRAFARAELLFPVHAGAFHPAPSVESAVVRLTPLAAPVVPAPLEAAFRSFVTDVFALRRKQMRRVLRTITERSVEEVDALLARVDVDPGSRPETLEVEHFAALAKAIYEREYEIAESRTNCAEPG
ncbi:MAG TPA: 16S rRNA (adenine(1518)-N(6)/adenine(1519)-N(6))-dimethyltransferase RsmA [Gemmatimonadaceae bacterium]